MKTVSLRRLRSAWPVIFALVALALVGLSGCDMPKVADPNSVPATTKAAPAVSTNTQKPAEQAGTIAGGGYTGSLTGS